MADELEVVAGQSDSVGNLLVPVESEKGLVAKVNGEVADQVFRNLKREYKTSSTDTKEREKKKARFQYMEGNSTFRASDLLVSRYAILGYVELSAGYEQCLYVHAVLDVPYRMLLMIHAAMGDDDKYNQFQKEVFGEIIHGCFENLERNELEGATFLDTKYCWTLKPDCAGLASDAKKHIEDVTQELISNMKAIDASIDKIFSRPTPTETPATFYQQLALPGRH